MSTLKAFQPNRDVPLLNPNGTLNAKWDTYFDLLRSNSNEDGGLVQEAIDAIYGVLVPAVSSLQAQIVALGPRTIQFKSADYTLIASDSGVVSTGKAEYVLPDARISSDLNYFIESAGITTQSSIITESGQTIAGGDAVLIPGDKHFQVANVKSNGMNFTLLSDRNGNAVVVGEFWVTDTGSQIVTDTGEKLVFIS